jgi:hypothetical protein
VETEVQRFGCLSHTCEGVAGRGILRSPLIPEPSLNILDLLSFPLLPAPPLTTLTSEVLNKPQEGVTVRDPAEGGALPRPATLAWQLWWQDASFISGREGGMGFTCPRPGCEPPESCPPHQSVSHTGADESGFSLLHAQSSWGGAGGS